MGDGGTAYLLDSEAVKANVNTQIKSILIITMMVRDEKTYLTILAVFFC
jgi:hypothetical protein